MNTNELIPFNWEEYQKGGFEALYKDEVLTEITGPDKAGFHCVHTLKKGWIIFNIESLPIYMRRKLYDAWVVVTGSHEVDFFRNEEDGINFKKVLDDKGYASEIHKIKTAL